MNITNVFGLVEAYKRIDSEKPKQAETAPGGYPPLKDWPRLCLSLSLYLTSKK